MPTITPFLWFDTQAEEAMNFYATIFPRAKVGTVSRVEGKVLTVEFELEGQKFMGLNGGPHLMDVMLQMTKLDIKQLQAAFEGK